MAIFQRQTTQEGELIYHDLTQYSYLESVFFWRLLGSAKCEYENNNSKYQLLLQISDYQDNYSYEFTVDVDCVKKPKMDIVQNEKIPEECFEFLQKICLAWSDSRLPQRLNNFTINEYLHILDNDRKHCFTYECFRSIIGLYYDYRFHFNNTIKECFCNGENDDCQVIPNFFSVNFKEIRDYSVKSFNER